MPKPRFLLACRGLAWLVACGVLALVWVRYGSLPAELPLSRWRTAPKTPLVALRVPGINLLSLALTEVLARAIRRAPGLRWSSELSCVLLGMVTVKAAVEATGLLVLPRAPLWTNPLLAVSVAGGLALAGALGWPLWRSRDRVELALTTGEKGALLAAVAGIVLLELPLAFG
jgi:hypothetical protein